MKMNLKSLKFRFWLYFSLFSVLIIILLWCFQIFFINIYYEGMKKSEVEGLGGSLANTVTAENYENLLTDASFKNNVTILLLQKNSDTSYSILYNSNNYQGGMVPPQSEIFISDAFLENIGNAETENGFSYIENLDRGFRTLIYGAEIEISGNTVYFYMSSGLQPIEGTVSVLKNQLVIISIILLVLAFIISYAISKRLTRPIAKISEAASELAKGRYSIRFEGCGYAEIDRLADTLNYATGELEKTDSLRKELIANVSHDLRTPLTIIKAYAEMIRDISGKDEAKRNSNTEVIIREADRLTALINDIMNYSKLQANTEIYNMKVFDLSETALKAAGQFSYLSERDGYIFNISVENGLNVNADEMKIGQVLYNLIGNAVNYAGEKKIVDITLKSDGKNAKFEVTDHGQGISQDEIGLIWERYYRSGTGRHSVAGTGLGLSIVKSILTAHNAKFGVSSKPGEGSTFWFMLSLS